MLILDNMFSGVNSWLNFMEHPMQSIMIFIGGILLLVIVYKILVN